MNVDEYFTTAFALSLLLSQFARTFFGDKFQDIHLLFCGFLDALFN